MEYLFRKCGEAWTQPHDQWLWHNLYLFGIDGTTFHVSDSDENDVFFGMPSSRTEQSTYPQARVTMLMVLNARVVRSAKISPHRKSERATTTILHRDLPHDSVCLMDRGLVFSRHFSVFSEDNENRHLVCRVRSDHAPQVLNQLSDGSWLIKIQPTALHDKANEELPRQIILR